jgi:hypothetical protein
MTRARDSQTEPNKEERPAAAQENQKKNGEEQHGSADFGNRN